MIIPCSVLFLETKKKWKEVLVLFANTGQEHEKTLEFINNCDQQFGFNTVWLEAVTHKDQKKALSYQAHFTTTTKK